MRPSPFLFAFTIILSIQLLSVHTQTTFTDPFVGKWTTPEIENNSDLYCCVPKFITITNTSSSFFYSAVYQWNWAGYSDSCGYLFGTNDIYGNKRDTATLTISSIGNGVFQASHYSDSQELNMLFNFKLTNNDTLSIFPPENIQYKHNCRFTMTGKISLPKDDTNTSKPSGSSGFGGIIVFLIVLTVIGLAGYKHYQTKQLNLLAQQKAEADDSISVDPPRPNPVALPQNMAYAAPNMYVAYNPNQQFVQPYAYPQQAYPQQAYPQQNQGLARQASPQENKGFTQQNQLLGQLAKDLPREGGAQEDGTVRRQEEGVPQPQGNTQKDVKAGVAGVNIVVNSGDYVKIDG